MASQLLGVPEHTPPGPHASSLEHASPSSHASPVSAAHTPSEGAPFLMEHAQHAPPSHGVSQQMPSTQMSLSQSSPIEQGVPSGVPGLYTSACVLSVDVATASSVSPEAA
jgi:hypothetical protein